MTFLEAAKQKKKISHIWLNGANGDITIWSNDDKTLYITEEYLGDRSEIWVVEENKEGVEIIRHNVRYISSISWQ